MNIACTRTLISRTEAWSQCIIQESAASNQRYVVVDVFTETLGRRILTNVFIIPIAIFLQLVSWVETKRMIPESNLFIASIKLYTAVICPRYRLHAQVQRCSVCAHHDIIHHDVFQTNHSSLSLTQSTSLRQPEAGVMRNFIQPLNHNPQFAGC